MCVTGSSSVRWRSLHKAYSGHGQTDGDGWRIGVEEELDDKRGHDARGCHQENPFSLIANSGQRCSPLCHL